MTSGYTALAIGALALLMVAVINANRLIVNTDVEAVRSEQYSRAAALAEALFGEMKTKKFDENTSDSIAVSSPSQFKTTPQLGPDGGEIIAPPDTQDTQIFQSMSVYDDLDDYKGYVRKVYYAEELSKYTLKVRVFYINDVNYDSSYTQTYLKKIIVTVENLPNINPISFSTIYTY